ncbi:MAG: thiamine phosphate synthase [Planctomycetota bacterium]|nr:thiamine phosphate synthase [Planctomycetota bacterium]
MRKIYRILDANFNRAREALRVIEDFARFVLDDADLSSSAKDMRSRLRQSMECFGADAMLATRDTPGDVGTAITSATEADRPDAAAVATAACKRLTESLRTLEEYAKVANPASSGQFESMRYAAYTLEQRLTMRLAGSERFNAVRLYVLLTSRLCRSDPVATAQAAIAGGADCIQVREKEMPDRKLLAHARRLREITRTAGALLIINDRPDIAAIVGADGVHLGQDDLPVAEARRSLGEGGAIVGVSTHNISQARAAVADGADYIGVGPMFPTTTKDAGPIAGVAYLKEIVAEISLPHVAVGGITVGNVGELVAAGARRAAVCSAVIAAADPAAAAAEIKKQLTP